MIVPADLHSAVSPSNAWSVVEDPASLHCLEVFMEVEAEGPAPSLKGVSWLFRSSLDEGISGREKTPRLHLHTCVVDSDR